MAEDDRPPICPRCGVTMVPAELSAEDDREGEWVCLECEELGEKQRGEEAQPEVRLSSSYERNLFAWS